MSDFGPWTDEFIGSRVEIPAHTDAWMKGDRYGELIGTTARPWRTPGGFPSLKGQGKVKMDKSGRVFKFDLDDLRLIGEKK